MPSSSLISLGRCAQGANLGIVVMDSDAQHLWRSFDFASRHAFNLPLQLMTRDTKLVSALASGWLNSGFYTLFFGITDMRVLLSIMAPRLVAYIYWPNPYCKAWTYNRATCRGADFRKQVKKLASKDIPETWSRRNKRSCCCECVCWAIGILGS